MTTVPMETPMPSAITIKLAIDTKSNKVIFAEASKEFVDFLFFLLNLPIGTVIKLLSGGSKVGSIMNIYISVIKLDNTYLQPDLHKNVLLNPMIVAPVTDNNPLMSIIPSSIISGNFYNCKKCRKYISPNHFWECNSCHSKKYVCEEVKLVGVSNSFPPSYSNGYVKEEVSYMVSDDLSVTHLSSTSMISIMNKFNVSGLDMREVKVGAEEGRKLLKYSIQSKTVLTDVFLDRNNLIKIK